MHAWIECKPGQFVVNGKNYSALDRIPVKSLVTRTDRGISIKRGGPAELIVMPTPPRYPVCLYLVPAGGNLCFESDPKEGKHFEFI